MKIILKKQNGKILASNKQLESIDIPNRFRKRTEIVLFGDTVNAYFGDILGYKEAYIIGDCEDEEIKYYIPVEWVMII